MECPTNGNLLQGYYCAPLYNAKAGAVENIYVMNSAEEDFHESKHVFPTKGKTHAGT